MISVLITLCLAALAAPFLIKLCGRWAFLLLATVPAGCLTWLLLTVLGSTPGTPAAPGPSALVATPGPATLETTNLGAALSYSHPWLPSLHLNITFRVDHLSLFFACIVLGIGAAVLLYCWGYFNRVSNRLAYFSGYLMAFAAAMFGLVTADNLLLLYIFWEITSLLSFLLVGYYAERASSRRAALQALMVTTAGGLAMLAGIVLFSTQTGVWELSGIPTIAHLSQVPHITTAAVLILVGALSKSAIAPAHFWLPGAMAAPTPVSAYLHSAAMVKAGIYLVARLSPQFHEIFVFFLVAIVAGLFTMLLGGWMALKQQDLKLILAYGTVSQLGFIISLMAVGTPELTTAGLALTAAHSLFKAALFMSVGLIDHTTGTRDIRKISGLGRKHPGLATLATLAGTSMAGIPPMLGFIAKETALDSALHAQSLVGMPRNLVVVAIVAGSALTMAYTLYFLYSAYATKPASHASGGGTSPAVETMEHVSIPLWLPPAILTAGSLVLGLHPAPLDSLIGHVVSELYAGTTAPHLQLWHGFTLPLLLTGVILSAGILIFWQRRLLRYFIFETPALGSADTAYDSVLAGLRRVALWLTKTTQRGSLSFNLGSIFLAVTILPLLVLALGARPTVRMVVWDTPFQGLAAGILIVAAVAATRMKTHLSGILLVGLTGYATAVIFTLHGAPDLALTQFLVETISVVIFMLVLRKLPAQPQWRGSAENRRGRAWLAAAAGFSISIVTLFAVNARNLPPVSSVMNRLALEIGHGRNTVNVILVDIRSWDTFGEITVLVILATGVSSLIYGTRVFTQESSRPRLSALNRQWLATHADQRSGHRSMGIDILTRLLFPTMMVVSVYFFFTGHNAPGGGFAGGLVAALAFTLRYLAAGRQELEAALPIDSGKILGLGLVIAASSGIIPMLWGQPPLTTTLIELGEIHIPTAMLLDAGVYLVVIGTVMHILRALGGRIDLDSAMRLQRVRNRAARKKP